MNVFNELTSLYSKTVKDLESVEKDSDAEAYLVEKQELLEEIIQYRDSYDWLYKNTSKDRMRVYLENGCDYNAVCENFDIDYDNATSAVNWGTSQFEKKIGKHTIEYIKKGYIDEARAAFYTGAGKLSLRKIITQEFQKYLPEPKYTSFSLQDCKTELKILKHVSTYYLLDLVRHMNKEKMAYLLYLIEGSSKKADIYKLQILCFMQDMNFSVDELIELESEMQKDLNKLS